MSAEEKKLFISGPEGLLEGLLAQPSPHSDRIAVLSHPHPLHGGTMHNKVVSTLGRVFQNLGFDTLRFNYRGVGQSQGVYDSGVGELKDLESVVHWLKSRSYHSFWLAGFSFGSYIAATYAALHQDCQGLIAVALPVNHFDCSEFKKVRCPWILVEAGLDEIVPSQDIHLWLESQAPPLQLIKLPEATHFFHGHLLELKEQLTQALNTLG